MAAQPAIILPAAEVLYVELGRRVRDNLSQDASAFEDGLADLQALAALVEQHALELQASAGFCITVINLHHVAFTYPVLPGPVFKNCVHRWLRASRHR
jgi:hypothetical protein